MNTDRDDNVRMLLPSPIKSVGMAISSAVISVLCFRFWTEGLEYAWIAGSFLAAGAIFYMMHLVPGAYALRLSRQGFEVLELYTLKRYVWPEVSEFMVRRGILGATVQFYHHPPGATLPSHIKLNETFGYAPYKMAEILNHWRDYAEQTATDKNVWRADKK